ncbi:hypothetical protein HJFPF1_00502 [Paramyrothecium foliicola]|nr:hypothetical protein HJFPF1_00502 [Paramyrothecium foliicola]
MGARFPWVKVAQHPQVWRNGRMPRLLDAYRHLQCGSGGAASQIAPAAIELLRQGIARGR